MYFYPTNKALSQIISDGALCRIELSELISKLDTVISNRTSSPRDVLTARYYKLLSGNGSLESWRARDICEVDSLISDIQSSPDNMDILLFCTKILRDIIECISDTICNPVENLSLRIREATTLLKDESSRYHVLSVVGACSQLSAVTAPYIELDDHETFASFRESLRILITSFRKMFLEDGCVIEFSGVVDSWIQVELLDAEVNFSKLFTENVSDISSMVDSLLTRARDKETQPVVHRLMYASFVIHCCLCSSKYNLNMSRKLDAELRSLDKFHNRSLLCDVWNYGPCFVDMSIFDFITCDSNPISLNDFE
jgi:hypothetical protein